MLNRLSLKTKLALFLGGILALTAAERDLVTRKVAEALLVVREAARRNIGTAVHVNGTATELSQEADVVSDEVTTFIAAMASLRDGDQQFVTHTIDLPAEAVLMRNGSPISVKVRGEQDIDRTNAVRRTAFGR
jgi:hypothetical protein